MLLFNLMLLSFLPPPFPSLLINNLFSLLFYCNFNKFSLINYLFTLDLIEGYSCQVLVHGNFLRA